MDTLSEKLTPEAARRSRKRGGCNLGAALRRLSEEDRSLVEAALADRDTYPGTYIAAALRASGWDVSQFSVRRHRNRECACD